MKRDEQEPWTLDTLLVHGSQQHAITEHSGIPTVQPISPSTTYLHADIETLDHAFGGELPSGEKAYVYARQGNPNAQALENLLAEAEHGAGAVVFGSGMAAIHAALLTAGLTPGAKILVAQDLYGPTIGMLRSLFIPFGVEVMLRDLCDPGVGEMIRDEQPDVIYVETLSNPLVKLIDLHAISAAARESGAVTIIDSTFATPYLIRPIEHGFDLVIHSATKYMGGHGDTTAGVVICAQNAHARQARSYATMLGAMLSPFDAFLVSRGLKTLPLRMERQCANTLEVAHFLQQHASIARVHYPGLPDHPQHELAARLFRRNSFGGLLAFELKEQSREAAFRFMSRLQLCLPATTLGDVYTEVSYPPMSSHRNLTPAERQKIGITDGCMRLSVGIEDVRDIIRDLEQALE
ncbi:MAG TPA: aminotransferase class I/II-fold pyridoxal phosphate-dependent enzyme [Ktedonobacteraceae bacterium]|nr:aminotransferase class I/II-fold pyridoxal phosphate-dependent enzyme [Ktedonobacteraceae bacterium]